MGGWARSGAAAGALLGGLLFALSGPAVAQQAKGDRGEELRSLDQVRQACKEARRPGRRELYVIRVPADGWRFGAFRKRPPALQLDTTRNLRTLGGAVELFPTDLEPIRFVASRERAKRLRQAARSGAGLRIGFFLGFDNRFGSACLLRPAAGVSTVRMDLAFVEIVSSGGNVLAREDTERLRAWLDDEGRDGVPGSGPRGALGGAMLGSARGEVPESWQRALGAAHQGPLGKALGKCHAAGLERGARRSGQVVVRAGVQAKTGGVVDTAVELSSIGDEQEAQCVARAVAEHLQFPAEPSVGERVELSIPVRLASD
jgi:hypothetical protein